MLFVAVISIFLTVPDTALAAYGNRDLDATPILSSVTITPGAAACTDSDAGLNYLIQGSIQSTSGFGFFRSQDRCLSSTKLLEYTCKDNAWYANYYECEFGCKSGVCLATEAPEETASTSPAEEETNILPWDGSDISDFLDKFLADAEEQGFDFGQILSEEKPDDEDVEEYLSDFIAEIDFDDADIKDEDDLQEYLDNHITEAAEEASEPAAALQSIALSDGTLIKIPDDAKVYVIREGMKEWIETAEEFNAEGYDWKDIQEVNKEILEGIKDRIKLIKDELNKVYEIIGDKALWIPNVAAFNAAGYKWEDVEDLPGAIDGFYEKVEILEDEEGNLYYITPNGKKQVISSQIALESLLSGQEGEENPLVSDLSELFKLSSFKDADNYLSSIADTKLIQQEGDYKVYEIASGQKHWISSPEELAQKGYAWQDIVKVNPAVFGSYDAED